MRREGGREGENVNNVRQGNMREGGRREKREGGREGRAQLMYVQCTCKTRDTTIVHTYLVLKRPF